MSRRHMAAISICHTATIFAHRRLPILPIVLRRRASHRARLLSFRLLRRSGDYAG